MGTLRPLQLVGGLAASLLLAAPGCGTENGETAGGGGIGTGGAAGSAGGGQAGTGTGGIGPKSCGGPADCDAGTFCSADGLCIPDGTCGSKSDCAMGEYCTATNTCLPDGMCATKQDCGDGEDCNGGACVPGGGCGAEEFQIEAIPPNMLVVLDRSCSMRRDLMNNINLAGPNKWTFAVDAINQLTTNFNGKIRWGLTLFPDTTGGDCGQGAPAVPVAAGTETAIQTLLNNATNQSDANYPSGPCVTNIDSAIEQASTQPELMDTSRENFAVLITDGKQAGCNKFGGDSGTEMMLAQMFAAGISTFVVGFGGGSSIDPAQMDKFAIAGGVPNSGNRKYYKADNAAQLDAALAAIAASVIGCTYTLDNEPENENDVFVFFDNQSVPRDPALTEGWQYDPATKQLTFYGAACTQLKSGSVMDVDVVFGCNEPTPE